MEGGGDVGPGRGERVELLEARWSGRPGGSGAGSLPYSHVINSLFWEEEAGDTGLW